MTTTMQRLTVTTGTDHIRTEAFDGYWVLNPEEELRSDASFDHGLHYALAHTAKGSLAVYTFRADGSGGSLDAYDDLDAAVLAGLPDDIADEYRGAVGEVIIRDI